MRSLRYIGLGIGCLLGAGCEDSIPPSHALTFWVDVGPGDDTKVFVETRASGDTDWVRTELFDPNQDGVFLGGIEAVAGEEISYHFVKIDSGLETKETVPYECGVAQDGVFTRVVMMDDGDVELPTVYFLV